MLTEGLEPGIVRVDHESGAGESGPEKSCPENRCTLDPPAVNTCLI